MVDADANIVSCTVDQLPEWIKEDFLKAGYKEIRQLTFFYHPKMDVVVLNSGHANADFYELLVTTYLTVDEATRKELQDNVPLEFIASSIELLDYVIDERRRHARYQM